MRTTSEPLNLQLQFSPLPSLGGHPSGRSADWHRLHTRPLSSVLLPYGKSAQCTIYCPSILWPSSSYQAITGSGRERETDTHTHIHTNHTQLPRTRHKDGPDRHRGRILMLEELRSALQLDAGPVSLKYAGLAGLSAGSRVYRHAHGAQLVPGRYEREWRGRAFISRQFLV